MTIAIKGIVDAYVDAGNWAALEGMRAHRRRLEEQLQKLTGSDFDVQKSIDTLDEDLSVIEAALARSPARPQEEGG
jgi:hypothetical protein